MSGHLIALLISRFATNTRCYQEYFKLPNFESVPDAFTGHHPGPCTSLKPHDGKLYWTDAGWRGRWENWAKPDGRVERMWENGSNIANAVIMGNKFYVLIGNGRVDAFSLDDFGKEGVAPSSLTIYLPDDEVTGGKWSLMVPDAARDTLWVGNDEGEQEGHLYSVYGV